MDRSLNAFTEHFIAAPAAPPHLAPPVRRLAVVHFDFAADVEAAARNWEASGFVRLGAADESAGVTAQGLNEFCRQAPTLGASLVVCAAHPAPPGAVYLAPGQPHLRDMEGLPHSGWMPVEIDATPPAADGVGPLVYRAARIRSSMCDDLDAARAAWEQAGCVVLGEADVAGRNDAMGLSTELGRAAVAIGASLVLTRITPAKTRAIRRDAAGRIDMDAVRADPPASFTPRGHSVTQAVFLAPASEQAQARIAADGQLGTDDIPVGF